MNKKGCRFMTAYSRSTIYFIIINSILLFFRRPLDLSLEAIGLSGPKPLAEMRFLSISLRI
jgi:hypothetical protein